MSLDGVLSIASGGLHAIQGQIGVVSQNVANANSSGYTEEVAASSALDYGGQTSGVVLGNATRVTSPVLQTSLYTQNASVASQTVLDAALSAITSVEGTTNSTTGSTGSMTALLSGLQSSLTVLQGNQSSSAQQQSVLQSAQQLVSGINGLATTYITRRQAANDAIASSVTSINQNLSTIGSLSNQIVSSRAAGQSTAGLEDQRAAAMTQLSNLVGVKFSEQPTGAVLVMTNSGTMLPTDATSGPLSYTSHTLQPSSVYDGAGTSISNITLDGQDVTDLLTGGTIGANIALRDQIIPGYTSQLDSFAATVAQRLSSSGLPMFTDGSGLVPSSIAAPPAGFSSNIKVSANASALLSGASATTVQSAVQFAFGSDTPTGTLWPPVIAAASLPYSTTGTLADFATNMISSQGADAQNASANLADDTGVQTALTKQITAVSGVSIDTEMSKMVSLQNSYEANAKVIAAVQTLFTDLLTAVGGA